MKPGVPAGRRLRLLLEALSVGLVEVMLSLLLLAW